ncbi:MAG: hypothetical protein EBQ77_05000, partial [Sphingobacteriia bacterium]|nr:hypothetical protein [Sphingobacteriia bacterium]
PDHTSNKNNLIIRPKESKKFNLKDIGLKKIFFQVRFKLLMFFALKAKTLRISKYLKIEYKTR